MSRRDYVISGTRTNLNDYDRTLIRAMLMEWGLDDSESRDVIHSGAQTGVDNYAIGLARDWRMKYEPHPADWDQYGRKAGPIRNRAMLDAAQPNMCFAFPRKGELNKGTRDFIMATMEKGYDCLIVWLPEQREGT